MVKVATPVLEQKIHKQKQRRYVLSFGLAPKVKMASFAEVSVQLWQVGHTLASLKIHVSGCMA